MQRGSFKCLVALAVVGLIHCGPEASKGGSEAAKSGSETPKSGSETAAWKCPPNWPAVSVNDTLSAAPEVGVTVGKYQVQWTGANQAAFTLVIPDPSPSDPPYSGKPYPNYVQENAWTWSSCALTPGSSFPIPYSVTFTQSNKKIYGHIIINKD